MDEFTAIEWRQGETIVHVFAGVTVPVDWTRITFTLRRDPFDTADRSWLRVFVSNPEGVDDGVEFVAKQSAVEAEVDPEDATLAYDDEKGEITLTITPDVSALLRAAHWMEWTILATFGADDAVQLVASGDALTIAAA